MQKIKSVYIHIPFCNSICSYCDFCKVVYNHDWVMPYIKKLSQEIENCYLGEEIETLYIGGGTPSCLSFVELEELFKVINKFNLSQNVEFTFECNICDLEEDKLKLLFKNNVNRLSVGIESFNSEKLKFMNRECDFKDVKKKIALARTIGFNNINLDLMYAIPKETNKVLKKDLKKILKLKPEHVSTYSLIIEQNTLVGLNKVKPIEEERDSKMYDIICKKLKSKGYIHYEISNFAKKGYESKHNLTYWNNEEYYGFGCGASGYVEAIRYENTKSLTEYLKGNYVSSRALMNKVDNMENELILGFRKLEGINLEHFYDKFEENLQNIFPIKPLVKSGDLIYKNGYIFVNPKKLYIMNEILIKLI
ncbi:MAG: radical SAM family heme chaperone HemW [Firmicutes bacterium]|nr:radical SAM family heme chaperone HemW [Bacillota bacterium]